MFGLISMRVNPRTSTEKRGGRREKTRKGQEVFIRAHNFSLSTVLQLRLLATVFIKPH